MGLLATSLKRPQDFYETTLLQTISAIATTIPVASLPTETSGYLVLESGTPNAETIIYTGVSGNNLTGCVRGLLPNGVSEGAGTGVSHGAGTAVSMAVSHYYVAMLQKAFNDHEVLPEHTYRGSVETFTDLAAIANKANGDMAMTRDTNVLYRYDTGSSTWVALAAPVTPGDASVGTKGIIKTSVAPASATNPIAVGDNDPRMLSQAENDAAQGTVGTPSNTNRFVTNDDTTGTGSILRESLLLTNFLSNKTYTYGETITAGDTLYYKNSDSKVYKASASTVDEALYNYIGIALESGVLNDVKKVASVEGTVVTGLSLGNQTTTISETAIVTQSSTAGGNIHNLYDAAPTACGFISGSTQGNITKVTIPFGANNGSGATNVTMNLHEVTNYGSNNVTFGTSLGSVTITPTPSATNTFTFASPITIKPNVHYVLVFTATGGGASNYFTLQGSDDSIADTYFFTSGSGVTSPMTITTVGKSFAISVFSTLTFNYDINDYLFLGDTAGSYSFVGGTNKKVIGRILSSSSIVLGLPATRTLLKQYTSTPYTNGNTSWLLVPVPKNAVSLDGMFSVTTSSPTEFVYSFAMDLGKTQSLKQTVGDSTGANAVEMGISATWGRGQVTPFNQVGTYASHTLPINFYR